MEHTATIPEARETGCPRVPPADVRLAAILAAQLAEEMSKHFQVIPTLTLEQAAEALGVSCEKVRLLCQAGEIPYIKMDRLYRIKPADVNAYLERHYHGTK